MKKLIYTQLACVITCGAIAFILGEKYFSHLLYILPVIGLIFTLTLTKATLQLKGSDVASGLIIGFFITLFGASIGSILGGPSHPLFIAFGSLGCVIFITAISNMLRDATNLSYDNEDKQTPDS